MGFEWALGGLWMGFGCALDVRRVSSAPQL